MDGIHAECLQVIDGPGLCESEELAWILRILSGDGEVTMVHLVDHQVGRRLDNRALVTAPLFWIGLCPVDDGAAAGSGEQQLYQLSSGDQHQQDRGYRGTWRYHVLQEPVRGL